VDENLDLTLYQDATELIEVATTEAMTAISLHLLNKGVCHLALTGGTLGADFAKTLVAKINKSADLTGLNIWFSDERFSAADSPLRNAAPVHDNLKNSTVILHEVKASDGELTVQAAADLYAAELELIEMDICILGLGPDGHVASLFPNHWEQSAPGKVIAITDSPKPPAQRVSFSIPFINTSAQVWIIAAGAEKAAAVTQVLEADLTVPAGHVMGAELTRLIVDAAAFFTE
jgi:6-phosphogluconolactonase